MDSGGAAIKIHYEDRDLIVVDKPAGVVVHATAGAIGRPLLQRVRDQVGHRVWPLHRLDAATSGAIAFGRRPEVAQQLARRFGTDEVRKHYVALVRGVPPDSGRIDHPIQRAEGGVRVPAATSYRRIWSTGRYSLVVARPHTGRRHQIRRHLKHCSWPIIGDVRYGKGEHNRLFRSEHGLHRLALHAVSLVFHSSTGALVEVTVPLPPDLSEPLRSLGAPKLQLEALGSKKEYCSADGARD